MAKITGVEAEILAEGIAAAIIAQFSTETRPPRLGEFTYYIWGVRGYAIDAKLIVELNARLRSRHLKVIELPATEEEGYDGHVVLAHTEKHPTRL